MNPNLYFTFFSYNFNFTFNIASNIQYSANIRFYSVYFCGEMVLILLALRRIQINTN